MKGTSHLIVVGIVLAFTIVQLVSGKPDFDSLEFESSEENIDHEDHSDNHKHHQLVESPYNSDAKSAPVNPNTNNNQNAPQKAAPLAVGTNVSGFDEPCNGTRICNTDKNLTCLPSNSTCQCTKNFVYIAKIEGCLPIMGIQDTRGVMNEDCSHDAQCQFGKWGTYSRCEPASRRCQCNVDAIFLDNTCMLNRTVGASCVTDKQCNATIKGEAFCQLYEGSSGNSRFCNCSEGYIWDNHHQECLKVPAPEKAYNFTCQSDRQCQASSLGNISRCDHEYLQCRCYDPAKPSEADNAVVYRNVCYSRKNLNDTCNSNIECEAPIENAICEEHPAFQLQKVCQCPSGKKCEPRKNSAMGIFASEMSRSTLVCVAVAAVALGRVSLGQSNVI